VANRWNVGKKKPQNVYEYFKSLGQLITVFPAKGGWSFVADGKFYGPFPTRDSTLTHPKDSALAFPKHGFGALCNTTQGQFGNYQNHFREADFWRFPRTGKFA
jgi:hypothetical protein